MGKGKGGGGGHLCGKVMGGSYIMLQSYEPLGGGFTILPQSLHACKLEKVKGTQISIKQAANKFGIPISMLHWQYKGRNKTQLTARHPTLFTPQEEEFCISVGISF